MDARKHRCSILLAAIEPVAYRLVSIVSSFHELIQSCGIGRLSVCWFASAQL